MSIKHDFFMDEAVRQALKGLGQGGIPIGAVLVKDGKIIGRGYNKRMQKKSSILHAEMDCLENAGRLSAQEYRSCRLYSTLSPCDMCSGAIVLYKIPVVVIGENKTFKGPESYIRRRGVRFINLDRDDCKEMMKNFIQRKSSLWHEDIGE